MGWALGLEHRGYEGQGRVEEADLCLFCRQQRVDALAERTLDCDSLCVSSSLGLCESMVSERVWCCPGFLLLTKTCVLGG